MPDREWVLVTHENAWCSSYLVGAFVSINTTEPEYEWSCWCQPQIPPDTQDDGDDMVTFTVPADLAWLIGLVGASTFVMFAICLILRFIWKLQ